MTTYHELMTASPLAAVITRINIVVKLFPLIQPHFDQPSVIFVHDLRCSAWEGVGRRLAEDMTLQAAAIRREKGCSSKSSQRIKIVSFAYHSRAGRNFQQTATHPHLIITVFNGRRPVRRENKQNHEIG